MGEIVDFPSANRKELLVWQCNCGSRSFRLYSDRAAVCDACGVESAGVFGYWQIREMPFAELQGSGDAVVALRFSAAEQARVEQAMLDWVMQKPLAQGIAARGGAIICMAGPMWENREDRG